MLGRYFFEPIVGGALIGLSAVMLMGLSGRIAGVSGALARVLDRGINPTSLSPAMFIAGLLLAPWLLRLGLGTLPVAPRPGDLMPLAWSGLLVGAGTVLANGCTSGHGVCGLARMSRRSMIAVMIFMSSAIAVVTICRALGAIA